MKQMKFISLQTRQMQSEGKTRRQEEKNNVLANRLRGYS